MEKMSKSHVNYKPTDLRSPTKPKHMTQEKKKKTTKVHYNQIV